MKKECFQTMGFKTGIKCFLACLCAMILTGCGAAKVPDIIEAPTLSLSKEGEVAFWLVGDFDKEYYSISELTSMAVDEAAQFRADRKNENAVVVDKVEAMQNNSSRVVVSYRFDSCENCGEFLGNEIFFGTVGEAIQRGYSMDVIMRSVSDSTLFTEAQLKQAADKYLVITDIKANIYCPRSVTHISNDALLNEDGSVNPSMAEGPVYILLK